MGKFTWGNKAKHCWVMSTNFLFSKVFWQHSSMFLHYTFPTHYLNSYWMWRWWDRIQAIFLNLFYFNYLKKSRQITLGVRMSESNSTKSCCISSSSSWPTPDSSESSWWLRGVLTRFPDPIPTFVLFEEDELPLRSWCKDGPEFESLPELLLFGPPLVLLFELPIPLEPLPELGLRKLVLSRNTS